MAAAQRRPSLKGLFAVSTDPVTSTRWAYREAAAVLARFELASLRPAGGAPGGGDAGAELGGDSELVYDELGQPRWSLRRAVRRETLQRLIQNGRVKEALDANPDRDRGALQRMLEGYLLGVAPRLERQSLADLQATQTVIEWLEGLSDTRRGPALVLPSSSSVRDRVEYETLLGPFRALVGDHFAGRAKELAQLADYVGVLEASGVLESALRMVRRATSLREEPPLSIHGPGGIGKSTLVAKFILDHVDRPDETRFPFAYLDLDRPGLLPEEPITLLFEALRQLAIEFPRERARADALRAQWTRRSALRDEETEGAAFRLKDRDYYLDTFGSFIEDLKLGNRTLLLVIDTFEEAQLRSRVVVEDTLGFLDALQARVPSLRSVISGRVAVESTQYTTKTLELKVFDAEAGQAFLLSRAKVSPEVALAVVQQVGGSPMMLKLAAELLKREAAGSGGIKDLHTGLRAKLLGETIQSQLYTRILGHIKDDDVRKLAHPGLVLRRVTADIIAQVLAEPCQVDVTDPGRPRALFEKLRNEVVLVTQPRPDVLLHRPDLRAVMLAPLRSAEPEKVPVIHHNAIEFHERRDEVESRAEELYHRLSLGVDRAALAERWSIEAARSVASSIEELPPKSQGYVAARVDVEVSDAIWREADQEDWELHVAKVATGHLHLGKAEPALELLAQRTARLPGSPLFALEIDGRMQLGQSDKAWEILERAERSLQSLPASQAPVAERLKQQRQLLEKAAQPDSFGVAAAELQPTANQVRAAVEALGDSFTRDSLQQMLSSAFNKSLEQLAEPGPFQSTVFAVVTAASSEGWLLDLIDKARAANPGNRRLFELSQQLGLATTELSNEELQRIVKRGSARLDVDSFRRLLVRMCARACAIELHRDGQTSAGTGFLVGPDIVITTHDLLSPVIAGKGTGPGRVLFRFDVQQVGGQVTRKGIVCGLAQDWLIDFSPAAPVRKADAGDNHNYALVRLDRAIGLDSEPSSRPRGWINAAARATRRGRVPEGTPVLILHNQGDGPVRLTIDEKGVVGYNEARTRMRYAINAGPASSGAPCFNLDFQLVALHLGGTSPTAEGVPLPIIVQRLSERGMAHLIHREWDSDDDSPAAE